MRPQLASKMKIKSKGGSNKPIKINTMFVFLAIMGFGAVTMFIFMSALPSSSQHDGLSKHSGHSPSHLTQTKMKNMGMTKDANDKENPRYFMVFSTSCSPFQNWQGLAFFHFAKKVNQPGTVTRLVSGCKPEEAEALKKIHAEKIAPLSDNFRMHITPDYGVKDNQKYWNKPHGLLDYLEKELGFPANAEEYNDDIIIIVDPDMMLLRPITHRFDDIPTDWVAENKSNYVKHGLPVAQAYGFGSSWLTSLKGNLSYVVGPESPALAVTMKEAELYYPAGPPYLATGKDMYAIAKHWVAFLPRLHALFPEFMAEMHAYSAAAAHLQLPHQLATGFMLSDVDADATAFVFLKGVSRKDACRPEIPMKNLPFVLHYCQRYALGRWFFSKYKLREDFFECEAPLMMEPPENVGEIYDWYIFPNGVEMKNYANERKHHFIVENGWMMCAIVYSLNEVAVDLKTKHCGSKANFSKSWHFHDDGLFQAMLDDPTNPFTTSDLGIRDKHGVSAEQQQYNI